MNRTTLKDMKMKVLESLPQGSRLPLCELVSKYAADPSGPSDARATVLELKEEGVLELDAAGNICRVK